MEKANEEKLIRKPEVDGKDESDRGQWKGKFDFLISMIAYAVGPGNVWRFPYMCFKNGGGSFLVAYAVFFTFSAVPIFAMEVTVGQYFQKGSMEIWTEYAPIFKGVGIGNMLISFWCTTYICVIIAWSLYYLIQSFSYTFPWETCDNYWNNAYTCITGRENASQLAQIKFLAAQSNVSTQTSVEQYWENRVLQQTDSIDDFAGIQWELLLLLLLAWTITYFALWNGITEARKFVYFCALFPYFLIVVLLIRGLTLKGASTGIYYYLKPDITRLMGTQVWLDAGTQVFYSYGLGFGSLIALGSHNKFNHNCIRDAIVMCFINGSTSILAGFAIFSVLGYLSVTSGKDIAEIAKPGVGLAFLAYPEVASNLPMKQFFAFLFFLMLTILGLDSNVCTLEGLVTSIEDRFPVLRKHKRISLGVICLIFFILGLPMVTRSGVHWLTLVDAYGCSGYALLFVVFWEVVGISYKIGMKRIRLAVKEMIGFTLPKIADFILMIVSPTISLILFILCLVYYKPIKYPNGADYPLWAIILGWCLSLSSILIIPGYAIYYLLGKKRNQSFELNVRGSRGKSLVNGNDISNAKAKNKEEPLLVESNN